MTRVVCCGLGGIGAGVADECAAQSDLEVVGVVDPAHAGETIAGTTVVEDLRMVSGDVDVALFSTTSDLATLVEHTDPALARGMHVVSTCEELAYPWLGNPDAANLLDRNARSHDVTVVAAGVNPGFVMDLVPALACTASRGVMAVEVERRVNLRWRRPALARKLGVELDEQEWSELARAGRLGHRGLVESAHLCAVAAGFEPEGDRFRRIPLVRDGIVRGVRETATVSCDDLRRVRLRLTFDQECADGDEVILRTGSGETRVTVAGLNGDDATVARVISTARAVRSMPAGLRTPLDVPVWAGIGPRTGTPRVVRARGGSEDECGGTVVDEPDDMPVRAAEG